MEQEENGAKTDVVKLFIVLMAISAIGFGVGAAYLYRAQAACFSLVENEKKALKYIQKFVESPENQPYWGFESKQARHTTGADLEDYLLRKSRTRGIPLDDLHSDEDTHKEYKETKANVKLADVSLDKVVRYVFYVQQGRNDIAVTSLKMSGFDYEQPQPTCSATVDVVVYEEIKTKPK
jgi:hypothetical protein